MRTCTNVRSMTREANWRPQFLEELVYLVSIVEILVVLDVYFSMPLMTTFALQCIVNNLVKDIACCLWQLWVN
jgi:hypothetical protein